MDVKITGKNLVITIPLDEAPKPSGSGKSLIVASTRGNLKTDLKVGGKELTISVNAYTAIS